jgi:hypothetical protein
MMWMAFRRAPDLPLSDYNKVGGASGVPKAVSDDVQNYICSEKLPGSNLWIDYYENKTGQHAVEITQIPGQGGGKYYYYYLFYDKNNLRMKVKKSSAHGMSI